MVNINLVPEKVRAGEALKIIVLLGGISLVLPVLFWAWRFTVLKVELSSVNKDIEKVTAELNSPHLKQVVEEVEQFSRDRANLDSKRSVVDTLRKKQILVVRILDVVPDLLPRRAWLTKLELVTTPKEGTRVQVEGAAQSPEAVADLYANLESHPAVKAPRLDTAPTKIPNPKGIENVSFKLSFAVEDTL